MNEWNDIYIYIYICVYIYWPAGGLQTEAKICRQFEIKQQNKLCCDSLNILNDELNPICHLLALLGTHHILHVIRVRVNTYIFLLHTIFCYFSGGSVHTIKFWWQLYTVCPPPKWSNSPPSGTRRPHYQSFTITLRHTTLVRTLPDKW